MPAPDTAGYSLIETLVAIAIFSIAAAGLTSGVISSIRANNTSEHFTLATILAQDKLEALLAAPRELVDGSDTPRSGFTRTWIVTPDTPEAGVIQIDVSVSWTDYLPHSITVTTVVNE
ncbi:MAG: prepilin-type N-terminal cleavage/methylation domain-containing protein [Candidatus Binatia bacterium]